MESGCSGWRCPWMGISIENGIQSSSSVLAVKWKPYLQEKNLEKESKISVKIKFFRPSGTACRKAYAGTGKFNSLIKKMPADGLQVGRDAGGTVGDYDNEFAFDGKIKRVKIKIN